MLEKVSAFLEAEVDDAVEALASLMEPMIMAVLGVLIGGLVIAIYLPIFKLGFRRRMIELLANPVVFAATAGLFGLIVGSFLNVVIHRLPKMMEADWQCQCAELRGEELPPTEPLTLATPFALPALRPRHHGDGKHTGHQLASCAENVHPAPAPISIRYPLVEAATGLLGAPTLPGISDSVCGCRGNPVRLGDDSLTGIDFDTQLLPDSITPAVGLAGTAVQPVRHLHIAVVGRHRRDGGLPVALVGHWAFRLATGKEGMGYGDFKLLAAIGAWLGWQMLPVTILLSSLVGAIVGVGLIVLAKRGRNVPIPFGPYLAAAGLLALFWGKELNRTYLGLF